VRYQPFTDDELYAAVGRVVDRSAHASIFLDQVASGLAGTHDCFAMADLVDRPLGTQLKAVRRLADENPEVLDDDLSRSCDMLLACLAKLVPFRNRVVHDNWMKLRDRSNEEALFGHRPWGGGTTPQIWSSLSTFAELESAF
jgi:hypothetical protein